MEVADGDAVAVGVAVLVGVAVEVGAAVLDGSGVGIRFETTVATDVGVGVAGMMHFTTTRPPLFWVAFKLHPLALIEAIWPARR